MAQRKLTKEQTDKFYADYVKMKKTGNYAGEILDRAVWKAEMEDKLGEEATGINWSNTEIRKASHRIARTDSWSRKQVRILKENLKDFTSTEEKSELYSAMVKHFGTTDLDEVISKHQGAVFQFLKEYSGDWNEYFNS